MINLPASLLSGNCLVYYSWDWLATWEWAVRQTALVQPARTPDMLERVYAVQPTRAVPLPVSAEPELDWTLHNNRRGWGYSGVDPMDPAFVYYTSLGDQSQTISVPRGIVEAFAGRPATHISSKRGTQWDNLPTGIDMHTLHGESVGPWTDPGNRIVMYPNI